MAENRRWCAPAPDHSPTYNRDLVVGDPNGTRTRVFAVTGRRPRLLDAGAVRLRPGPLSRRDGARSGTLHRLFLHRSTSAQASSFRCISAGGPVEMGRGHVCYPVTKEQIICL